MTLILGRSLYCNHFQVVEGIIETVKKQENHPIEKFWNDYNKKRQMTAAGAAMQENSP